MLLSFHSYTFKRLPPTVHVSIVTFSYVLPYTLSLVMKYTVTDKRSMSIVIEFNSIVMELTQVEIEFATMKTVIQTVFGQALHCT